MATAPQFVSTANAGTPATITTANTATDGTGTVSTIFTAGSSGSYLPMVKVLPLGTNVATVVRLFLNNGGSTAVAGNNSLIAEIAMPANTLSQTAAASVGVAVLNLVMPAGYKITATISTTVAAGVRVTPVNGGDY